MNENNGEEDFDGDYEQKTVTCENIGSVHLGLGYLNLKKFDNNVSLTVDFGKLSDLKQRISDLESRDIRPLKDDSYVSYKVLVKNDQIIALCNQARIQNAEFAFKRKG